MELGEIPLVTSVVENTDKIVLERAGAAKRISPVDFAEGLRAPAGYNGWSPVLAAVTDGDRVIQQVVEWLGGEGSKPNFGVYVGEDGFVEDAADAVDISLGVGTFLNQVLDARDAAQVSAAAALASAAELGTRAQCVLATIPVIYNAIRTNGYATPGDRGGALYKRVGAQPAHAGKFQSAGGQWWELAELRVYPEMFGAIGDGTTDDSTALQNAIDFCKAKSRRLFLAEATYKVTRSLNCQGTSSGTNFWIVGEGRFKSVISHAFPTGEEYPVIDMCGNGRGGVRSIGVSPSGTSKATCGILIAKSVVGSAGNTQQVVDCSVTVSGAATNYAIVVYNSDLTRLIDTEGSGGVVMGAAKPASVVSKFITIPTAVDFTQGYIERCEFIAEYVAPLEFSGGNSISIRATYCALTGAGSAGRIFVVDSHGNGGGCNVNADELRTENQSTATGVPSVYFGTTSTAGRIHGRLSSDTTSAAAIAGAAGVNLANYSFNIQGPIYKLFDLSGYIRDCQIYASVFSGLFGSVGAGSADVSVAGNVTLASVVSAIGTIPGLRLGYSGLRYQGTRDLVVSAEDTRQTTGRRMAVYGASTYSAQSYTGGSGEQTLFSYTFPAILTKAVSGNAQPLPLATLKLRGQRTSGAVNGRVRVTLTQGANSVSVWDSGASLAAGSGGFKLDLEVRGFSTNSIAVNADGKIGSFSSNTDTTSVSGIVSDGGDITVAVLVTDANSNPLRVTYSRLTTE